MAKSKDNKPQEQDNLPKPTDDAVNDNAVQDTVSPDPADLPENDKVDDVETEVKQVNIPLSASNALQPEAGIQVPVAADSTEDVVKTDPYDPSKTKAQAELKEGEDTANTTVSKATYEQLKGAFNELLDRHVMDVTLVGYYKAKAGI